MFNRIMGIFKLDVNTFEQIEADKSAMTEAAIIVGIVALLSGLGSGFGASIGGGNFLTSFFSSLVWGIIGWFLWALVSYFVGTTFFGGKSSLDEMLRVIGYAYAPLMLSIIPCVGPIIGGIWALIAGFIAIRQGLDLDNLKAFLTALVGFILVALGNLAISTLFGAVTSFLN
jgi:hypothetical protein